MGIFLLTPLNEQHHLLANEVSSLFTVYEDAWPLQNSPSWLVAFKGTSIELSNHLQVTGTNEGSKIGSILITSVGSYYGRGPSAMWEWLKERFEQE
jgi:hypothetical protein